MYEGYPKDDWRRLSMDDSELLITRTLVIGRDWDEQLPKFTGQNSTGRKRKHVH